MPSDIKFIKTKNGTYDIDFENGDFALTDGLDSAILLSIFGEKRAPKEKVRDPLKRRGHFSNEFADIEGYQVGSTQWLYTEQSENSESNTTELENSIKDGLKWFVDDKICKRTNVKATKKSDGVIVDIELQGNSKEESKYYNAFINT
jgi:phage gp46-like protein